MESFGSFGVQYYDRRNNICHAGRGFDELQKEVRDRRLRADETTTQLQKQRRLNGWLAACSCRRERGNDEKGLFTMKNG